MKTNLLKGALLVGVAMTLTACGQRIKYDEAAVEVIEVGANRGVQEQEVSTSRYWAPPFSYRYIVKFPTTIQTFTWGSTAAPTFINADRVSTRQAVSMNIRINAPDADNIVRKYRGSIAKGGGDDGYVLDDIVNGPITRELQQAFIEEGVGFTSVQLYADGGRALLQRVKGRVAPKFAQDGIIIQDLMSAAPPTLPEDIVATIKASLLAVENAKRKDAELAATVAEGKKTIAQAQADGEARRITAESIRSSPEILKLEELKVHKGLCPLNANVCVIGGNATALVQSN